MAKSITRKILKLGLMLVLSSEGAGNHMPLPLMLVLVLDSLVGHPFGIRLPDPGAFRDPWIMRRGLKESMLLC